MGEYTITALTGETWEAFATLCAKNNGGGMGNCWCTWFHREKHSAPRSSRSRTIQETRDDKQHRVETGCAHAALVFDKDTAVGWAQFGSPEELPGIKHRKEYLEWVDVLPDYRITCFLVDRRYRGEGVAVAALNGALKLIAAAGGGVVETYPQDTPGKNISASFLYNATRPMFERAGFTYERPKGKNHCIMRKVIEPS
jgi:GNAT superfamily N-acetyltransferase